MFQVRHKGDGFKILTYKNLMVTVLERAAAAADVGVMMQVNTELAAVHRRVLTVSMVCNLKGVPRVEADMLKRFEEYARVAKPHSMGTAMVMEGSGLQMSLIRTVTSFLALSVRSVAPEKVFSEFEAAMQWLMELPDVDADLKAQAGALVQEFRLKHAATKAA